jgi:hypothetical protein
MHVGTGNREGNLEVRVNEENGMIILGRCRGDGERGRVLMKSCADWRGERGGTREA